MLAFAFARDHRLIITTMKLLSQTNPVDLLMPSLTSPSYLIHVIRADYHSFLILSY